MAIELTANISVPKALAFTWLRVRMTGDSLIMEVDYRLEDTEVGCQLTWLTTLTSCSLFGSFMGLVFNGFSEPVLRRQLAELKRLSEAEHMTDA